MIKIGDFARLSQVSVVTLRYYDEMDLLKPVKVDAFTGYRFYAVDQLPRLNRILALGGVPKDVGLGLVDFPHRRGGEVVNLCWKFGEREIRFWHGLDEGYAGRKPL